MRPKTAPVRAENSNPEILENARKFLQFMYFIRSASPETVRSYRSDLTQAFGFKVGELPKPESFATTPKEAEKIGKNTSPAAIPPQALMDICRAALHRWSNLAPASRNRKAATLKSFLGWLYEERAIDRDLALHIHAPKVPVRVPHHLSADEAVALLKSLQHTSKSAETEAERIHAERDLALILLMYGGGLRVSEACKVKWSEVDRGSRVLRVLGKGGKERLVALPPIAIDAVFKLKNGEGEFVFGTAPLNTRAAYDIVRSRGAQAGLLKPLHPHALRHSFATHLLTSGANLRTLQELLGHNTLQATQRYTHLGLDQLANTLEEFHPLGNSKKG